MPLKLKPNIINLILAGLSKKVVFKNITLKYHLTSKTKYLYMALLAYSFLTACPKVISPSLYI